MTPIWTVIVNPRSCSGKGARQWPKIEALLRQEGINYKAFLTEYAGHAMALVHAAIEDGARNFLAVGGDGTVHEVANGILTQTKVPSNHILLAQIPIGTGNDWRRTLGIPKDHAAAVRVLKNWREQVQDVGLVEWQNEGKAQQRYFINVAGMGFEAAVGVRANADKAAGKGGLLGYIPALLGILKNYQSTEAAFSVDNHSLARRTFFSLAIGICKFNGGGMQQCPTALLDDGLFEMTVINQVPKSKVILNFPRIFTGTFIKIPEVEQHSAGHIVVDTEAATLIEVDGENLGCGRAVFTVVPKALRVAVPG